MGIFDKAKNALNNDKGEKASDAGLDKAADAAQNKVGEKHADKINTARDKADERLGNEGV